MIEQHTLGAGSASTRGWASTMARTFSIAGSSSVLSALRKCWHVTHGIDAEIAQGLAPEAAIRHDDLHLVVGHQLGPEQRQLLDGADAAASRMFQNFGLVEIDFTSREIVREAIKFLRDAAIPVPGSAGAFCPPIAGHDRLARDSTMSGPYKRNAAVRKLFPARTGCWSDTLRRMLPGRARNDRSTRRRR